MYAGELESKILNFVKSQGTIDHLLKKIDDGVSVPSVDEAKKIIYEVATMLKSKTVEFQ